MDKPYIEHRKVFINIRRLGIPQDVSEEIDDLFATQELGGDDSYASETPDSLDEVGYNILATFLRKHDIADDEFVLISNPC